MTSFHTQPASILQSQRPLAVICCLGLAVLLGGSALAFAQDGNKATVPAQSAGEKSLEGKIAAIERERDDLKRRNADLEQRLKQLQGSVDNQVQQALGAAESNRAYSFSPPPAAYGRRMAGPFVGQFRPVFPFGGLPDPVELAIAYSDALGEKEAARPALDAAKQKVDLGRGGSATDVEAASARLSAAERKARLLRSIVKTSRAVAAEDVERMRKLGAVHAVSLVEVRNTEARLKILDEILSSDPEAAAKSASENPPSPAN
jgi:cell division septum initiation protein DivIVA